MRNIEIHNKKFTINGLDISDMVKTNLKIRQQGGIALIDCTLIADSLIVSANVVETTAIGDNGWKTFKLKEDGD